MTYIFAFFTANEKISQNAAICRYGEKYKTSLTKYETSAIFASFESTDSKKKLFPGVGPRFRIIIIIIIERNKKNATHRTIYSFLSELPHPICLPFSGSF
jgi:hypothetical protein